MADLPPLDARIYTKEVLSEGKSILEKHDASGEYKLGLSLIKRKFLQWGVMWLKREPLDHVGTDEVNRGGLGVTGVDGERHGLELTTVGINADDLKAWAVMASRHPPTLKRAIEFNDKQIDASKGLIPPLKMLAGTSIGGSHTSVFFRQALHGVKCVIKIPEDGWVVTNGHLDPGKLAATSPDAKQMLNEGLEWHWIHDQAPQAWPGLKEFLQKALNTEARLQRTEDETFHEMWHLYQSLDDTGSNKWEDIELLVVRALPPCSRYIKAMTQVLKTHTGAWLDEYADFCRVLAPSSEAALGGELLQEVGLLDLGKGKKKVPLTAMAILCAARMGTKVVDGLDISVGKAKSLRGAKYHAQVLKMEKILEDGRKLLDSMGLDRHATACVTALGWLSLRCVSVLCDMPKKWQRLEWEDMDAVSED